MRLIDADALLEQMEADAEHIDDPICKMLAYAAVSDVKHAPTIEPQRKRGKWIGGELGRCSVCGHEGNASDIWNGCKGMFCPNCGADMR